MNRTGCERKRQTAIHMSVFCGPEAFGCEAGRLVGWLACVLPLCDTTIVSPQRRHIAGHRKYCWTIGLSLHYICLDWSGRTTGQISFFDDTPFLSFFHTWRLCSLAVRKSERDCFGPR